MYLGCGFPTSSASQAGLQVLSYLLDDSSSIMRALFQLLLLLFFLLAGSAFEEEDDSELFQGSSEEAANYSFAPDSQNDLLGVSLPIYESFGGDSSLEARQAKKCPFPVKCSATTCCPANTKCVSNL